MTDKERVRNAFVSLRAGGYVARQSFMCCSRCAAAAIEDLIVERGGDPEKDGAVFYSKEEGRNAFAYDNSLHQHGLALSWQGYVDKIIAEIEQQGLRVEWDGDPRNVIMVYPKDGIT